MGNAFSVWESLKNRREMSLVTNYPRLLENEYNNGKPGPSIADSLSVSLQKLPGKLRKLFEEFETIMDPSRNHRVYRLTVAKLTPHIIPFMPLLMKGPSALSPR